MEYTSFRITELSVGWMFWQVRGPGIKEDIAASWIGYPTLDPMLRLATTMLTFRKEGYYWPWGEDEWDDYVVGFDGEPECYKATFYKPEGEVVDFMLEFSEDDFFDKTPYKVIARGKVNMMQFADDLIEDAAALLRDNGFVGFHENWKEYEYPIAEFLRLLAVRKGREPYREGFAQEIKELIEVIGVNNLPQGLTPPAEGISQ